MDPESIRTPECIPGRPERLPVPRGVEDKCGDNIDEIKPIEALWIVWPAAMSAYYIEMRNITMISEKAPLRTGEIGFYPNDKKAIERVFRHVRCNDRFNAFWDELTAQPDISYQLSGRTLFKPDMIYEFFREHGFSGYFEKQRLRT